VANEAESRRWNDPGWAASWQDRERVTDAVSPYVLKALDPQPGQRVCEIGCGGGALSLAVAAAVAPEGEVVGLDISAPLVQLARDRAASAGVGNVRFVAMDVQTGLEEPGPFSQAVSQFGVMFFDEPTLAFTAIRARLAAGGRFVFACWQEVEHNLWHVRTALRPLLSSPGTPPPPGKSPVGPFTLGDDEYVHDLLDAAGFWSVVVTPHEITVRGPASSVVDQTMLEFMGVPAARLDEASDLVERHLEQFAVATGEYEFPLAFRVYEANNA
jgi:SAM-dependent methyltransferase